MTMNELSRYLDTIQQIERDTEILQNLRAKSSPASPVLDGVPHGKGGHADKVAALAVELAMMEDKLSALEDEAAAELEKLEAYISGVSDERAAVAMRLRFVRGMAWADVAQLLGLWDASGARKVVSRYLSSH